MKKNSIQYTFLFALIVCVICSFALALVSEGLRPFRKKNEEIDVKKNILRAAEIEGATLQGKSVDDILSLYDRKIKGVVINAEGEIVEGKSPKDIKENENLYPLYIYRENGEIVAYIFPVSGKGLWSTIYGFLALQNDAITIRGITFYKDGETPGLGGEVGKAWFQNEFKGKKIYDVKTNKIRPVRVIKGKVEDKLSGRDVHFAVDGISGATLTSKGVSAFLAKWIKIYNPYFEKVWEETKEND